MTSRKWRSALALALGILLGCRGGTAPDAKEGAPKAEGDRHRGEDEHGPEEVAGKDGGAPREVRIDAEMLRDLRITTAKAEKRPGGDSVGVMGELQVDERRYAEVGAPVAARAVRVLAAPGQRVRRGAGLVELQSLEVGRARGAHGEATARVDLARRALERKRSLAADRIAPQREVQEAEADLKMAQAQAQAARAELQAIGATAGEGGRFVLRSPIDGTVIERKVSPGQVTDPSAVLFKVADITSLWVTANAYERDALRVREGEQAGVTFPALPGQTFAGTVVLIGGQVDASSRTLPIRVAVANPARLLRPGMAAKVLLPLEHGAQPVVAVPATALQRLNDRWCVFIPTQEGEFEIREVGRGRDLGGEVEVLSGLRAGETIVVEGAFLLKAEADKARGEGGHHDH